MAKIVIVDDQEEILMLVKYSLKIEHEVFTAASGAVAIEIINKENPELILLDMHMPEMSGYDVIKELKSNEKTKDIPIIAVTASVAQTNRSDILSTGCVDYISKPFDPAELLSSVNAILKKITSR